jgi:hypothetical protein
MKKIMLAPFVFAALAVFLYGDGLTAQQLPSAAGEVRSHDAVDHGTAHAVAHALPSDTPADYLTLNVAVSDTDIQPSVLFVPAERPVQLLLRNRGSSEHHYRVVGLVPDDLAWVARGGSAPQEGVSDDEHNHHGRRFLSQRAASPAGIRPTGDEVHAYVPVPGDVDVVLFTANQRFVTGF